MTNFSNQVTDGMEVFDANLDKIGTVDEVYDASSSERAVSGGGYLRVPTGFLGMGAEHHIPFSAISNVREGRIYLSVNKDRLDEMGYDLAPMHVEDGDDPSVERSMMTTSEGASPVTDASRMGANDGGVQKVQLREEELVARKRSVNSGEIRVGTEIVSEERTLEVPVTREEVTIERHAVDRRPSDRPIGDEETIRLPIHEEEVTLEKRPVVYEEVSVGSRAVQETEQVSGTVRREEARIDTECDVDVDGVSSRTGTRQP